MASKIQLKRTNKTDTASRTSITLDVAEPLYDLTKKALYIGNDNDEPFGGKKHISEVTKTITKSTADWKQTISIEVQIGEDVNNAFSADFTTLNPAASIAQGLVLASPHNASGEASYRSLVATDLGNMISDGEADSISVTETDTKRYGVLRSKDGKLYVNVPWTDNNTTYSVATSSTLGLVKIGYDGGISQNYGVELDDGKMYVNVPWTDTHYAVSFYVNDGTGEENKATTNGNTHMRLFENGVDIRTIKLSGSGGTSVSSDADGNITIATTQLNGTSTGYGLVKRGYEKNGSNLPVELDADGRMYVDVNGISVSGTISNATNSEFATKATGDTTPIKDRLDQIDRDISDIETDVTKLSANCGSTSQPVYIENGEPKATDSTYQLRAATSSDYGLVKVHSAIYKPTVNSQTTITGRYYGVSRSTDGKLYVNVPWTDTHLIPSLTTNTSASNGGTFITLSDTGCEGGNNRGSVKIVGSNGISVSSTASGNITISANNLTSTSTDYGMVKVGYSSTGKNYGVQLDASGKMFVNVPWENTNTTYSVAGANTIGLVKGFHRTSGTASGTKTTSANNNPSVSARTTTSGRYYGVETDATGAMYVNVPWTDTKLADNIKVFSGTSTTTNIEYKLRAGSGLTGGAAGYITFIF